jgi:Xaa-Pro aminopeptidase
MREAFGPLSTDWKEGSNWQRVRGYRLNRAREAMHRHGLGAMLLMYDENVRYVTSTLTPGWNRLKPGLRYAVLCEGREPIVYEQGDIGLHLQVHSPWIPKENVRHSFAWIKGAAGPASEAQVEKFARALLDDLEDAGVKDQPVGVDFIDVNIPGMEDVEDVIVPSGPNAWPNWRNFSDRIRPGDIVIIDLAALTWNGFKSCVYRTYCVGGTPTDEQRQYYELAHRWLWDAIDAVKPGVTTRDIASKWPSAQEAWGDEDEDMAAANLWGHGLGLAQYDQPVISRIWSLDYPQEIRPGMVFALETQHGKLHEFGVRLEEMLIVTETGHELVSTYKSHEIVTTG